ncbi:TlpA disulfide reductase family protein [Oleiagrimonas sp. MCCC 1A03011]|uniref:TlpA family protein disulfide reductase n=1 Tax=Oleiagrimonas sp. MCCC 1A03011 TaxID=1926883 RepID=UPI001F0C75E4|nr:TlpA disulfide reductase family protein [Oleiagrimonas sp. MCCC 1A03011]
MVRSRSASLGIVLLAAAVGFGLFGVYVYEYGVPPKLLDRLMTTQMGQSIAQRLLTATAPAPPAGVTVRAPGDALPTWTLPDAEGHPQPLAQWKGRTVLINFWATWCIPCRKEMPALTAAQRAYADKAQIVGIAMDDPQAVRAFLADHPTGYPTLLGEGVKPDPRAVLGNTRLALPFSVLVDSDGRIVRTHLGPLGTRQLAQWLR